ncbi:citrate lyase holo-[acyl-carrier protein] synthase [bacterium]|nr:citrate lyase holo-[acyl-carrier protein] synthase [candidate division CSSED10-310 bacterium]
MLDDILKAREDRAHYKHFLESQGRGTVVSFTINIPSGRKKNPKYSSWLCHLMMEEFAEALSVSHFKTNFRELRVGDDGPEGFMLVEETPYFLKQIGMEIEDNHSLGRLFDIDVGSVHRTDVGGNPRKCFVCNADAVECIVGRRHSKREIFNAIDHMITERDRRISKIVSELASRAVLYEIGCTPKPGLVDRRDSGPHHDMNYFTFLNSSVTLSSYFQEICEASCEHFHEPEMYYRKIIKIGRNAEKNMFDATGGINTQKGLIFSLGLACAAATQAIRAFGGGDIKIISKTMSELSSHILSITNEQAEINQKEQTEPTHGEQVRRQFNVDGIIGEATGGFQIAITVGLPSLKNALTKNYDFNDAMVHCLISLMNRLEDSNVLYRGGRDALDYIHKTTGNILKNGSIFSREGIEAIENLNVELTRRNIGTGGAADMLALSVFLYFVEDARL